MKNKFQLALIAFLLSCCFSGNQRSKNNLNEVFRNENSMKMIYPKTRKSDVVDHYFDVNVPDPYRWLEDDRSAEVADWVKKQNDVTFNYLQHIPYRKKLKEQLEKLWNYEKRGAPFKEGRYSYFYQNSGLQNQNVIYRQDLEGKIELFLDPNTFSDDGTTSLDQLSFSKDGSMAAYSISEGGSDWRKIIIMNEKSKERIDSPLVDIKFSGISWKGNEGFYYASYIKSTGSELSAKTDQHMLYYHKIGQDQKDDQIVFGARPEEKRRYLSAFVTEDDRYLVITGARSTTGNDLYIKDLHRPDSELITILDHFESDTSVIDNIGEKFFLVTNYLAPKIKIVTVDLSHPTPKHWVDFIPEADDVLTVSKGGGYFFAEYMIDAISRVYQYDYKGKKIREINLPGAGSFSSLGGKKNDKILYYSFSNYKIPNTIFRFEPVSGKSSVYYKSKVAFDSDAYVSKQIFYKSKDGTKIPMIITHKKDLLLDSKNPTILYGYGGFNINLTPNFSIPNAVWMEKGGIFAVPNIRGGGEYGESWHKAGTKMNKQNVFDDFIAAAQYLIKEKYTSSDYLAIKGGSNGGLLVGAVMTQEPDLIKVAIPQVGVLDMLRYHTFTAGAGWAFDYGTAEDSLEMFSYLKAYSPLHNVKNRQSYPATLITTGDHDDRVVPAHSFKFAAELQAKQARKTPVLIRIETDAGHGAGTPTSKSIDLYADIFSFIFYQMEIESLPFKNDF